jgi:uncharacterized phage-associated protein
MNAATNRIDEKRPMTIRSLMSRLLGGTKSEQPPEWDDLDRVPPRCGPGQYSALAVSNEMTAMGMRRSAMGHNKMVQIVQGVALALGRDLVPEMPEIWRNGPVLNSLYLNQEHMGSRTIDETITAGPFGPAPRVDPNDTEALALIERVVMSHSATSTMQLSEIMHAEGTPWKETARRCGFRVPIGAKLRRDDLARQFAVAKAA